MTANDCMWVNLANLTSSRNDSILVHAGTQLSLLLPSEVLGFQAEAPQAINLQGPPPFPAISAPPANRSSCLKAPQKDLVSVVLLSSYSVDFKIISQLE